MGSRHCVMKSCYEIGLVVIKTNLYTRFSSCERPEALVEAVGENDSL